VDASQQFTCGSTTIGFDSSTGGISKLKGPGGTDWASQTKQLAQPWYRNDDVDYYHQFDKDYNGHDTGNFMKPNLYARLHCNINSACDVLRNNNPFMLHYATHHKQHDYNQ
jgi:hypothetical protein